MVAKGLNTYFESLKIMNDLGPVDNIELALVLKTKRLLFVEGKTDNVIKKLAELSGYDLFINNPYVVIPRGGVDRTSYYEDSKIVTDFIDSKIKIYSIIDRDYRSDEESNYYVENSRRFKVNVFILSKKELENYLLIPSVLLKCINESKVLRGKPILTQDELNAILNAICESLKESTIDQYSNSLLSFRRKILDQRSDLTETNPIARAIITGKWTDLNGKLSCCAGSDILKELNKKLSGELIMINVGQILNHMIKDDISEDLKTIFRAMK